MYFNVASFFYYHFIKLLRKLSCENTTLLYPTFIKLENFTKALAAILSLEVLQIPLSSSYNIRSKEVDISFAALLMQNFSRVINCEF